MALHKNFPINPHAVINPEYRWYPGEEDLREQGYEKLLPPLVAELRKYISEWRDAEYEGASETSKALLRWWFQTDHTKWNADGTQQHFQYFFAQREAVETAIWLHDVARARSKYDLLQYAADERISPGMFDEDWLRFVIKMATGSGKTKVISLLIAWSYFHRLYEESSDLARNFLVIAPNIIVLERLKADFSGLKIFSEDPVVPDNGYEGQNWHDDFQLSLHVQDQIGAISDTGNIFLTNIHRVFEDDIEEPSFEDENVTDYFLGPKPVTKTNDNTVDLGEIVRDIDELAVFNDEAHHIHDKKLAWFQSIEDIHNRLKQKGANLSLQLDVTATPKDSKGNIFVQTITDYPIAEAIHQHVVKTPVLPDEPSRALLEEKQSSLFTERYQDFIDLGVQEWQKTKQELSATEKKPLLFVMTDDTKNCDEVQEYLERAYSELEGKVLTIHTNKSGEISEKVQGKKEKELNELRAQANEIDSNDSPYEAIVSVLMLKEGWDVRNVTTIVGLRSYSAKANILPEQTLGRGLRRMFFGQPGVEEYLSVIGTPPFMEFVESIKSEGVELDTKQMNRDSKPIAPEVIEVDYDNTNKDIEKLDIELPVLSARIQREYKNLNQLDISQFEFTPVDYKEFSEEEKREIVFEDPLAKEEHHTTILEGVTVADYQRVLGFFANSLMRELHLFGCYDILFGKLKEFVRDYLFGQHVQLDDMNTLRNLSELEAKKTLAQTFKKYINELTVQDVGDTEVKNYIKVSEAKPFVVNDHEVIKPNKSVFNKIVGDSSLELEFADFLEGCTDIVSFAKNYQEIHFRIDYRTADGYIAYYYPDFFVKKDSKTVYVIETKGREDLDDVEKVKRLEQWCRDATEQSNKTYIPLYVKQEEWENYTPQSFEQLVKTLGG